MALHVTQCPSCESSFNTNAQLLKAASGKVRCGSCLLVFVASEHFLESANDGDELSDSSVFVGNDPSAYFDPSVFLTRRSLQEASDIESREETPKEPLSNPRSEHNSGEHEQEDYTHTAESDPLDSDPEANPEDLTLAVSFSLQHSRVNNEPQSSGEDLDKSDGTEFKANVAETHLSASIGESSIDGAAEDRKNETPQNPTNTESDKPDLEELDNSADPSSSEDNAVQNELWNPQETKREALADAIAKDPTLSVTEVISELSPTGDHPPLEAESERVTPHTSVGTAEDSSLLDDEDLLTSPQPEFELEPDTEESSYQTIDNEPQKAEALSQQETKLSTEEIRARALGTEFEDEEALEVIPELNLDQLGKMATPVDLGSAKRKHWGTTAALGLASLLLAAVLAGQYFWRNLPLYSQLENFRPAYVLACNYLGCQLPPFSNIDAIVSDELNIRSHPEESNALAVNISFRNTATVAQRFPVLILSFNSSQNEIVALREFSPEEYLNDGLRGIEEMPPGAPIQIQLEIMDPGPFAVNYTLAFRNP